MDSKLSDFYLLAKPLIDAYETCSLTDPNDDFYLNRDLNETHSTETLKHVIQALTTAISVQFSVSEDEAASIVSSWEFSVCSDWRTLRSLIQEELK